MKARVALALACVGATAPAQAQVVVTVDAGSSAYACFMAAKTGVDLRDGIANCTAALNGGTLTPEARAATLDNRGVLYDAVKNYSDAWTDFNTSIHFNPNLGDPYLNRGVALIRLNQLNDALVDIQKGITLGISLPQIGYYDRAVAEEDLGRITEAYYDFKRALAADPNYAPASEALKNFQVTVVHSEAGP